MCLALFPTVVATPRARTWKGLWMCFAAPPPRGSGAADVSALPASWVGHVASRCPVSGGHSRSPSILLSIVLSGFFRSTPPARAPTRSWSTGPAPGRGGVGAGTKERVERATAQEGLAFSPRALQHDGWREGRVVVMSAPRSPGGGTRAVARWCGEVGGDRCSNRGRRTPGLSRWIGSCGRSRTAARRRSDC